MSPSHAAAAALPRPWRLALTALVALGPGCRCEGPALTGERFACATSADCIDGHACDGGVCVGPPLDAGAGGGTGGGAGGGSGGGAGGGTGGGLCEVVLPATWSNDVDDGGLKGSWTGHSAGPQSVNLRVGMRFDISNLPVGKRVTAAELSFHVNYVTGVATKTWSIGPYGGDGLGDPEADPGSAMYSACDVSGRAYVAGTTGLRTTGLKTFALGTEAYSDLAVARDAGARFSVAVMMDDETGPDTWAGIDRFDQGSSMGLHVTCVAP